MTKTVTCDRCKKEFPLSQAAWMLSLRWRLCPECYEQWEALIRQFMKVTTHETR